VAQVEIWTLSVADCLLMLSCCPAIFALTSALTIELVSSVVLPVDPAMIDCAAAASSDWASEAALPEVLEDTVDMD